jgi:hypothetical protein
MRLVLVVLVALLAWAPAVRAEVIAIDAPGSRGGLAAGPVYAGGALVWVEQRPAFGVAVRSWRPGRPGPDGRRPARAA